MIFIFQECQSICGKLVKHFNSVSHPVFPWIICISKQRVVQAQVTVEYVLWHLSRKITWTHTSCAKMQIPTEYSFIYLACPIIGSLVHRSSIDIKSDKCTWGKSLVPNLTFICTILLYISFIYIFLNTYTFFSFIYIHTHKCIDIDRYKLLQKYVYIFCKKHLPTIPNSCGVLLS